MAGKAATLNIDIVAKADQALETFDKVREKTEKAHSAMKVAAVVAAGAIFAGLTEATKAAGEHEAGVAKLAQAYKNAGVPADDMKKSLDDIEESTRKTGQSTEDSIQAYTTLVTATRSTTKAHSELATAQDLAAYKGISVSEAALAITRAQEGNTRALKEMGIATTDTAGKQLPAAAMMKSLQKAVEGQADAFGKTAPGQMARFHESMDQTKEKIGEALLPALKSVLDMLQPLFAWLTNNQKILSVLAPIIAIAAGAVVAITVAMRVWTAVQWLLNIAMEANPIGLVVVAVVALIAIVVLVVTHFHIFQGAIGAVWGALRAAAGWISSVAVAAFHGFMNAVHDVWAIMSYLGDWVSAHWRLIVGVLLGPLGFVIFNFGLVKQAIEDVIRALEDVGRKVQGALGWLGKIPSGAGSLLGKLNPFSLPPAAGPAPMPSIINLQVVATPGDDLPEVVYRALREYQRRHVRPELGPLFAGARG
jgi:hypothetical protein